MLRQKCEAAVGSTPDSPRVRCTSNLSLVLASMCSVRSLAGRSARLCVDAAAPSGQTGTRADVALL
eukprot:2753325-Pleurochrysis_carterae.AAC.1